MLYNSSDLLHCKQLIEQKLDWGPVGTWASADFDKLQQRIVDETGVSLSVSTLRRIWGRVDYEHIPSSTTLNTLAQFAGYSDWRHLVRSQKTGSKPPSLVDPVQAKPAKRLINWPSLGWMLGGVLLIALLGTVAFDQNQSHFNTTPYRFSSRPLTRRIPNSVVFSYDASAAPTDSVFIQQSWDPERREHVVKDGHTHTSIYYEPGFYQAKLVVGHQIVEEHPLLIPTQDWLAIIVTKPIPIYLKPMEFIQSEQMELPLVKIQEKNVALQPQAPLVKYANVGNFKPVPVTDFAFSCRVKNEYDEGSAACQRSWIVLITDGLPITIPLSTKGCVSELALMDGTRKVTGKTTDLSAFGVDFTNWIQVSCHSDGHRLYYVINDRVVYSAAQLKQKMTIVGIVFGFRGTGAVKDVTLQSKQGLVFEAF